MARLTFESVKQYASEHGYTLERVKTGYSLNGLIAIDHPISKAGLPLSNLQNVLRVINEGYLLDGQFSIVDWNLEIEESEIVSFCICFHTHCNYPDIHDQPLPQYCGLAFNDQFFPYELTEIYTKHKGNSKYAIPEMVRYCADKSIFLVKPPLENMENKEIQKCIYPNCGNPCFIECDESEFKEKEDRPEKSHNYKPPHTPQKISQPSITDIGVLNEIGIAVIDTYQLPPIDISQYLQFETTKQRVIDICNHSRLGHISRDSSRFDISRTILRILRNNNEKYLKWHLSVNCSKTELSDQQFWNLALEVLVS